VARGGQRQQEQLTPSQTEIQELEHVNEQVLQHIHATTTWASTRETSFALPNLERYLPRAGERLMDLLQSSLEAVVFVQNRVQRDQRLRNSDVRARAEELQRRLWVLEGEFRARQEERREQWRGELRAVLTRRRKRWERALRNEAGKLPLLWEPEGLPPAYSHYWDEVDQEGNHVMGSAEA